MGKDLRVAIDEVRLNIRCGLIMRHGDDVVLEISKVGRNSVIPGGRIQTMESSKEAIKREIFEEMGITLDENRIRQLAVLENFFTYEERSFHEIYFLYEYILSPEVAETINAIGTNMDNKETYFKFVEAEKVEEYNLLPKALYEYVIE